MEEEKFKNKVTCLSYILAVGVIFRHAVNFDVYKTCSGMNYQIQFFWQHLSGLIVPTFFSISGFLFYRNFSWDKLIVKWKRRFFSLVIPYLIWNLIAYFYYIVLSKIPFISSHINNNLDYFSVKNLLVNLLLGKHNILWFIRYLIIYVYVIPLFYPIIKRKYLSFVFCIFVAFLGAQNIKNVNSYILNSSYFIFGACCALHCQESVIRSYNLSFEKFVFLLISLLGIVFIRKNMAIENVFYDFLISVVGIVVIWILADLLRCERIYDIFNISFLLYVSHSMILESLEKLFFVLLGDSNIVSALDFILSPILTVGIITGMSILLKKIPKLYNVLTGGR